ncbi:3 beta-hydroxysteroid dehydrogenase/Delta 5--_4-isomerase type 1 [Teleopsis dalmanni]|uniref:3 beta-hydroxysteroid dehydrogenase/Delta 5-->4-isomerase type 1 n=1 Tax=Teleopsis dalmanni TaxID=139649 RepID=UPI0018CF9B20|nr:3 beta-hydroxysteroid dehydrogenase/Delta 5-->4-isomerase type 1 [Teleopsis dalmanni]
MTTKSQGEVVLVTGGSGFIGQHLIKQLLRDREGLGIAEVRSLDIAPYKDTIGNPVEKQIRTFVGDINDAESVSNAFKGVDCVFHVAALVSIEYPPNYEELERVNVDGTRSVVDLCVNNNVKRLIFTSCASVCVIPFKGSTFTIVINQTESKAATPAFDAQKLDEYDKSFLIPGYSSSKLRAEKIVLNANGTLLSNRQDYLSTVALRPPLTYGEGDSHFVPQMFDYLSKRGFTYPRIAGAGGKHQLVYAGNVAWGHICAYKTLKSNPKAIAGLPVFVTDDTPVNDVSRFIQKMAILGQNFKVNQSVWYIPHFLFFFFAFMTELIVQILYPFTKWKLSYSLRAISSFTASVLMFNRLRASIHMDYTPLVESEKSLEQSAYWYSKWWKENGAKKRVNRNS